jgi:coenzyme Q-binding protein COQ10
MPSHAEQKIFTYSAQQLFDIVIAVDQYPEFLPWCLAARINDTGQDYINADLVIGYKMFRENFRSRVNFTRPNKIEVEYQHGPMEHLVNQWQFKDLGDGTCQVNFYVEFDFKSPILGALMNKFFNKAVTKMMVSFEQRAKKLYEIN